MTHLKESSNLRKKNLSFDKNNSNVFERLCKKSERKNQDIENLKNELNLKAISLNHPKLDVLEKRGKGASRPGGGHGSPWWGALVPTGAWALLPPPDQTA